MDDPSEHRSPMVPDVGRMVTERVRLVRELARGGMGSVWVARHLTLDVDVAVKFLLADDPVRRERLSREAQLAARVDHPNAVRVLDNGVTTDGLPFMVMELLDGEPLSDRLLRQGALSLDEVRRLVAQLGGAIEAAHRAGVVHRDVKPSNVVLMRSTDGLVSKLVDFGIARPVYGGDDTLTASGQVVGTTLYLPPEQLIDGLPPDHRADLWGIAVTAYEALTRRRPYPGQSAAAVGASMVLRRCEPISSVDSSLPAALDGWFERALHLDPRERHSSAAALVTSFEAAATSTVPASTRRASPVFRVADQVRGRDRELEVLEQAFASVDAPGGRSRFVAIAGWSGVGKTAIVEELRLRLRVSRAIVVSGKFAQFETGVPYQGLLPALRELVRRTLAQPDLARWRIRVAERIGDTGQVLVELVDEMSQLLGPQPEWPEGGSPTERRNQLHVALGRLVDALASPDRPIVVFLDDLQWADPASLDLVAALATEPSARPVLFLGAYRDNEVEPGHPLHATLDRIRAAECLDEVTLGPLSEDAVLDIVSGTFPESPGRMRLATTLYRKTHGNAFFLRRLLESLVENRLVTFDHEVAQWRWDQALIDAVELDQDVVAFVGAEIARMAAPTREALAVAACVGDTFPLELVARALSVEASTAIERLAPAISTELVAAAGRSSTGQPASGSLEFRFVHDRVRQAARGLLSTEQAATVHRRVGRYLLDHLQGAERERRLFELVDHLNRGFDPASGEAEPLLVTLNLQAARRAIRSAAFAAGHSFFQLARRHLPPDAWATERALVRALHVEGARAAWLAGDHAQMESLVATAVAHAADALERTAAREVSIQGFLSQQRFLEALTLAIQVLSELGLDLPTAATPADAGAAVTDTLTRLQAFGESDLDVLPRCEDLLVQARQRIQIGAMSSAYMAAPNLLPVLACNIVRATLDHGTCRESPYGFAALGLVLVAVNLVDAGFANGRIAADMMDRVGDRTIRPRVLHLLGAHVRLFVEPLRDSVDLERQVARLGMDTGDLEYAAWGLHAEICNAFYAGVELRTLAVATARNVVALAHHQQLAAHGCTIQYARAMAVLMREPGVVDGDEAGWLEAHRAANFRGAVFITTVVGTYLRYVLGDEAGAAAFADAGAAYADGAVATYHLVWFHQLRALAHLGARGAAAIDDVAPNLEQLRLWQRSSPTNHDHRVHLLEGELARVSGRTERALAHFDEAVASAVANGFLHEEALAHELAAKCDAGNRYGRLERARAAYARWGALEKVVRLDAELVGWQTSG